MDAQAYILITLVVAFVLFVIVFIWISMVSKSLVEIQLTIKKVEGILWKMNQLLSAQNVDAKRLTDHGQEYLLQEKPES